jgi:MFS family permease
MSWTLGHRTALTRLAVATAVGSIGLAAGGSAGALLANQMTGSTAWAGVPLGALVIGSAAAAFWIARQTSRRGRAVALVLGYDVGAVGAAIVIFATSIDDFPLVLIGSAALGAGNAAIFLTRYAAVELGGEAGRGRALGLVFLATAIGAVASPNLLGPSGDVADVLGLQRPAGLYLVAIAGFLTAGLLLGALSKHSTRPGVQQKATREEIRSGLWRSRVAILVLAASNLVMVAVMAIAPVHLVEHGHSLDFVGVVISVHVLCMFAPSPLTGWLADRAGSGVVAALGGGLLVAAGLSGALLNMSDGTAMTVMLAGLGLGWNAGVVGGTTMLAASAPAPLRPHTEGIGEIAMGLAAGAGAPIAGLIVAVGDFPTLSIAGAIGGVFIFAALRLRSPGSTAPLVGASG